MRRSGFSLLEIILSIALIAILVGISTPVYQSFQNKNGLDLAVLTIATSIRRAATLSQASEGDVTWGVKVQTSTLTLFKGASYAARDTNYDEITDFSQNFILSGWSEMVFSKLSGFPQATGTLRLTSVNNDTKTVIINEVGMVSY